MAAEAAAEGNPAGKENLPAAPTQGQQYGPGSGTTAPTSLRLGRGAGSAVSTLAAEPTPAASRTASLTPAAAARPPAMQPPAPAAATQGQSPLGASTTAADSWSPAIGATPAASLSSCATSEAARFPFLVAGTPAGLHTPQVTLNLAPVCSNCIQCPARANHGPKADNSSMAQCIRFHNVVHAAHGLFAAASPGVGRGQQVALL